MAPVSNRVGNKLGTVIEPNKGRYLASLDCDAGQCVHDTIRTDRVINHDGEALAAELVDDVEHLHLAAINGVIELEIHGP